MIPLECVCANTRRAARLITQIYSHEMGPGIEPSQFVLLSALKQKPGCPQVALGEALGYDKTTLSRSLRLMQKNGWVQAAKAEDQRERGYVLTAAGKKLLAATEPKWRKAQDKVRAAMKEGEWDAVRKSLDVIARVAASQNAGAVSF